MKKKIIAVLAALVLLCSSSTISLAQGGLQPQGKTPDTITNRAEAFQSLNNINGDVDYTESNGLFFLSGTLSSGEKAANASNAIQFMQNYRFIFGLHNASSELFKSKSFKDGSDTFVCFNQKVDGIPVEGATVTVHFDARGQIASVSGYLLKDTAITKQGNLISEGDAVAIAKQQYKFDSLRTEPIPEKFVITIGKKNYVAYQVNISSVRPKIINYNVYVDAYSGNILHTVDLVETFENQTGGDNQGNGPANEIVKNGITLLPYNALSLKPNASLTESVTSPFKKAIGSGIDVQGIKRTLNISYFTPYKAYTFADLSRSTKTTAGIGTFTLDYSWYLDDAMWVLYPSKTFTSVQSDPDLLEYSKPLVSAHYNAGKVIDFYKKLFNRNSLDNDGMEIDSLCHVGYDYNNAFWDGYEMVYGDGDGTNFTYFSGDLDVVGHEMTHGVDSNTCDLVYENQPGALNESLSDIFGVLIETYSNDNVAGGKAWQFKDSDWVVGDEIYTPDIPGDALRSLADPHNGAAYGDINNGWQPANMGEYVNWPDDGMDDWGGVHINSGIPNHAAYLIAKNIGMLKTAKIYYRAMTDYMVSESSFFFAGLCLGQAAKDLYGASSNELTVVKNSLAAVGMVDLGEPNETMTQAALILPGPNNAYISSGSDVDWFKFDVTNTAADIAVSLDNIPDNCDYNISLYDSSGNKLGQSVNPDQNPESINYTPTQTGTYYVKVDSAEGFDELHAYTLTVGAYATDVSVDSHDETLYMGNTLQLNASIDAPSEVIHPGIVWMSCDPRIATVDGTGKVTPVANGTVDIRASSIGGTAYDTCTVTVCTHATGVTLDKTETGMLVNDTMTLIPTVAPATATDQTVTWTSNTPGVATVDLVTGEITGAAVGDAEITATTDDGNLTASCKVHVVSASHYISTPPVLDSAVSASYNSVALTWDEDFGATGYDIYRSTSQMGTYTKVGSTTALTYTDMNLTSGTIYWYKIVATRTIAPLSSPFSNSLSAKPIPSAPTSFSLSVASYNSVKVAWSAVAGATKYEVYCILPDSTTKLLTTTTALNYTHKSLLTGQTYGYYVRAYRKVGSVITEGAYTSTLSIAPYLLAPQSVKAARTNSTSIKVSWKSVAGASGYQVYRRVGASGSFSLWTTVRGTSFTDKSLTTGTTYYYYIVAYRTVPGYSTPISANSATVYATP